MEPMKPEDEIDDSERKPLEKVEALNFESWRRNVIFWGTITRVARAIFGISQAHFASLTHISRRTIIQLENMDTQPSADTKQKLSSFLKSRALYVDIKDGRKIVLEVSYDTLLTGMPLDKQAEINRQYKGWKRIT